MSFHTFPENGIISFDFFTCGKVHPKIASRCIIKKRNKIINKLLINNFDTVTLSQYDDIYSSPGLRKYYIVKDVLENFTSKVGQHIEILN